MTTAEVRVADEQFEELAGYEGLVQLVSVDGQRTVGCPFRDLVGDVGPTELRDLYADMAIARRLDAEAMALQRQGELCLWAPSQGQEAAQVGSARAATADDFLVPSYREHAVALCRGVDLASFLRMWRGVGLCGWDPAVVGMANPAIVVGAQTLHAVGYALGMKLDGAAGATLVYFGDGASSQGDVAEGLGFAASYEVPVVFFCQNNQWAISEPVRVQAHGSIARRGRGYGIAGLQVDGNDVLAVLAATRFALGWARAGRGPMLLEAVTYRMGPHTTADDPRRYRSRDEEESWRAKDPLVRLRSLLRAEGALDDGFEETVEARAAERAGELRRACLELPEPAVADLFEHVYADPHPLLAEERVEYEAFLSGFDDETGAGDGAGDDRALAGMRQGR